MKGHVAREINAGNVEDIILDVLAENLSLDRNKIRPDSFLVADLGLDSFGAVELMFELENRCGIDIPDQEVREFKQVKDIVNYVGKFYEAKVSEP